VTSVPFFQPKKKPDWQSAVCRPLSHLSVTQRYVLSRKSAVWIPGRAWFTICWLSAGSSTKWW